MVDDKNFYKLYFDSTYVDVAYCGTNIENSLLNIEIMDTSSRVYSYDQDLYNTLTGGSVFVQGSILMPMDKYNVDRLYLLTLNKIENIIKVMFDDSTDYMYLVDIFNNNNHLALDKDAAISYIRTFMSSLNDNPKLNRTAIMNRLKQTLLDHGRSYESSDIITIKFYNYKSLITEFKLIVSEIFQGLLSYIDNYSTTTLAFTKLDTTSTLNMLYISYINQVFDSFYFDIYYKQSYGYKDIPSDVISKTRFKYRIMDRYVGIVFTKEGRASQPDGKELMIAYNFTGRYSKFNIPTKPNKVSVTKPIKIETTPEDIEDKPPTEKNDDEVIDKTIDKVSQSNPQPFTQPKKESKPKPKLKGIIGVTIDAFTVNSI